MMVRVLGIDPGTSSFDFCGLDNSNVFLELSVPTRDINQNPEKVLDVLESASPLDLVFGPSGYGIPLKEARKASPRDEFLMRLAGGANRGSNVPIRLTKLLRLLVHSKFPIVFGPGVKHLRTVPNYRKVNKIDMGTTDKVCAVALAIVDQATHLQLSYNKTCFILLEIGYGFNAVIGVKKGKIIDGIGGTSGSMGFLSAGSVDGEVACLHGQLRKSQIFKGGAAYVAKVPELSFSKFLKLIHKKKSAAMAWECWMDSLTKDVASMKVSIPEARDVLISGSLAKFPKVKTELEQRCAGLGNVRRIKGISEKVKEAAQGAALIADGLAGGAYATLTNVMDLKHSSGTVLDNLYIGGSRNLSRF